MKRRVGDIEGGGFETKPIGWYHVKIKKSTNETGRDSGNPYLKFDMVILDGEYTKSHLFKNLTLTEKALPFLKPFLMAVGCDDDFEIDVSKTGIVDLDGKMFEGKQLQVHVKHKMYQGEPQEDVDGFKSIEDAVDTDELGSEEETSTGAGTGNDEEIPF